MEDPNLILNMIPINQRTFQAFEHEHNSNRYNNPPSSIYDRYIREPTASTNDGDEADSFSPLIQLRFDKKPKDITQGFVFGSDPTVCDALLGTPRMRISGRHFRILFDDQGRPIIESTSKKPMTVKYNNQCGKQKRDFFRWIFFYGPRIVVTIDEPRAQIAERRESLVFEVQLAEHITCQAEYQRNVKLFLEESRTAFVPLDLLNIQSREITAASTRPDSPNRRPIYYKDYQIGRGQFGTVYKTLDVTTGREYASKLFFRHEWRREVEILRVLLHKHIVQFIDFTDEVENLLVIEYLHLGDLRNQRPGITPDEAVIGLSQGLMALEYLHSQGRAHRDIKPENILVKSRKPFIIKLADFGMAKDASALETCCGSRLYAAPEVYEKFTYTALVDIWSLGLVTLEFAYGIPTLTDEMSAKDWYIKLEKYISDWDSDELIDFLSTKMLRMNPMERIPASDCLSLLETILPCPNTRNSSEVPTELMSNIPGQFTFKGGRTTPVARARGLSTAVRTAVGQAEIEGEVPIKRSSMITGNPQEHDSQVPADALIEGVSDAAAKRQTDMPSREASKRLRSQQESSRAHIQAASPLAANKISGFDEGKVVDLSLLPPQDRPSAQACLVDTSIKGLTQLSPSGKRSINAGTGSLEEIPEQPTQILDPLWAVAEGSEELDQPIIIEEARKRSQGSGSKFGAQAADKYQRKYRIPNHNERTTDDTGVLRKRDHTGSFPEIPGNGHPRVYTARGQAGKKMTEIRRILRAKQIPPIDEDITYTAPPISRPKRPAVTDADDKHIQLKVDNRVVMMRKEDCMINATQILLLAKKSVAQREKILKLINQKTIVEMLPAGSSWIDFQYGLLLCKHLQLEEKLGPLINYGLQYHLESSEASVKAFNHFLSNASEFIEFGQFSTPVMILRAGLRINASNILKLAGRPRSQMRTITGSLKSDEYEFLAGAPKYQGTYVDFEIGMNLCRQHGLVELEQQILHLKPISEDQVHEALSAQTVSTIQNIERVLDSARHIPDSPQKVSSELNQPQRSAGGLLLVGPIQPGHKCELESTSDRSTSPASSTCSSMQRNDGNEVEEIANDNEDGSTLQRSVHDTDSRLAQDINRNSPAAKASHCSSWTCQTEKSRLSQVHPNLDPGSNLSWRYGSVSDMSHPFLTGMECDR